jgi:hypothetical protein
LSKITAHAGDPAPRGCGSPLGHAWGTPAPDAVRDGENHQKVNKQVRAGIGPSPLVVLNPWTRSGLQADSSALPPHRCGRASIPDGCWASDVECFMAIRWEALTVDAHDPRSLAQWWAQTLDWELVDRLPGGVEVRQPQRQSPSLFFLAVPNAKESKNRLHLDMYADDQGEAVAALIARGATRADVGQPRDAECIVMRDPEGNEFCLLEPR